MANAFPRIDLFSRWVCGITGGAIILGGSWFAIWLGKQAANDHNWLGVLFCIALGAFLVMGGWTFARRTKVGFTGQVLFIIVGGVLTFLELNSTWHNPPIYDKWGKLLSDGLLVAFYILAIFNFYYERKHGHAWWRRVL